MSAFATHVEELVDEFEKDWRLQGVVKVETAMQLKDLLERAILMTNAPGPTS
ncbi:MAG: hypothetical protein ACJ8EY_08315 [Sphingomicrobium sp.]